VKGIIEAHSTLSVPLDVTAEQLDEQETTAHFVIVGSRGFSLVVISCCPLTVDRVCILTRAYSC